MKSKNSKVRSDDQMMSSKLKSSNSSSDSNTIESAFQDGGSQPNLNTVESARSRHDFARNMDGSHMNSDINSYPQSGADQNVNSDSYGKMGENMPSSQMSNYNGGFGGRGSGGSGFGDQQHGGGMTNTGSEFPQQNAQYNQYGQQNIRPGYPGNPGMQRGPAMTNRPGMGGSMMPPNYPPSQQRFLSGPSIQQQGGPTPTLNQLLQNANSGQRYQGNYPEYAMNPPKGVPDNMGNNQGGFNPPQGWNGPQRPGMNPYQQMQQSSYRNQVRG